MKAKLVFEMTIKEANEIVKALSPDINEGVRVNSKVSATKYGLEILIKARDLTSLRGAINTWLKLYETISNVRGLKCLKKTIIKPGGTI